MIPVLIDAFTPPPLTVERLRVGEKLKRMHVTICRITTFSMEPLCKNRRIIC